MAKIVAYNGKGVSKPLNCGPNRPATAVRTTTNAVATSIRSGVSHEGGAVTTLEPRLSGKRISTTARLAITPAKAKTRETETSSKGAVSAKKIPQLAKILPNQPRRSENQL